MMNDPLVKTDYSFRFIAIDRGVIESFGRIFPEIPTQARPYFRDKNKYVLSFSLDEAFNFKKLKDFVNEHDISNSLDIFMAMNSYTDNYIVGVPAHVMEAIRGLPVKMNISFMYNGD